MKVLKYSLLTFFTIMAFPMLSQGLEKYTITGHIGSGLEGKKVYLFFGSEYRNPLDSASIINGVFKLNGTVASPHLCYILIVEKGRIMANHPAISFFLENSHITITAELDIVPMANLLWEENYPYNQVSVKGSKSHDLFLKYFNANAMIRKKIAAGHEIYQAFLKANKSNFKTDINQGIEKTVAIDAARKERIEYIRNFVKNNPDSEVSLTVIEMNFEYFSVNDIKNLLSGLSTELKKSPYGQQIEEKAATVIKTAVGAKFVDFSFKDNNDNNMKLSDYLGKGKYVLLELWASWCGPCIKDLPHLKSAYELYHPSGFEIIQISMDDNKEKWIKALDEQQMKWLQVSDLKAFKGDFSKIYNFDSIPTCILISPDGEILDRDMRESWMDRKLIELYGNKFADK